MVNTYVDKHLVNRYVYREMKSGEAKRYLQKLGAKFEPGKGGHLKVTLNGRRSVLPMHGSKELKKGTWLAIQKQLGLKERE